MDLKHLTDDLLLDSSDKLVQTERDALTSLLHHLKEIERRRLFCKFGCGSLLEFAIKRFKYSEAQAIRRISAMRMLKNLPSEVASEIEEKINSGDLNLTNLVVAQTLFNHEQKAGRPMDNDAKVEVLSQLENQSTRAAIKIARTISPEFKPKSALNFDAIEDEALRDKLLRVKGKLAHSHPDLDLTQLLHMLCDKELEVKSPAAPQVNSIAQIKREIWKRDQGKCTNCSSTYAVQEEHIVPKAADGTYTLENMKLLCRKCNQRSAIEFYGQEKMEAHFKGQSHFKEAHMDDSTEDRSADSEWFGGGSMRDFGQQFYPDYSGLH